VSSILDTNAGVTDFLTALAQIDASLFLSFVENRRSNGAPATLLSDGRVLVSGGAPVGWNGEVYTP